MLYETATSAGVSTLAGAGAPLYEFPMTQLWLARSTDGGLTWTNHLALDTAAPIGPVSEVCSGGRTRMMSSGAGAYPALRSAGTSDWSTA